MAKKKKLSTIKKKVWVLISRYVRLKNADSNGYVKCVTCNTVKHYKELHAGHFIPQAQGNAVKFDLRNINPQCYRCNINLGGNGAEYYPYMLEIHGQEVIDELRQLSNTTRKFTIPELEDMELEYKQKLKELEGL